MDINPISEEKIENVPLLHFFQKQISLSVILTKSVVTLNAHLFQMVWSPSQEAAGSDSFNDKYFQLPNSLSSVNTFRENSNVLFFTISSTILQCLTAWFLNVHLLYSFITLWTRSRKQATSSNQMQAAKELPEIENDTNVSTEQFNFNQFN